MYKWGWDQKRKKYGPELAALMMPSMDGLGDNPYFSLGDNQNEGNYLFSENNDEENSHLIGNDQDNIRNGPKRLFDNPTPFPKEDLLDKLSTKLA